ncbi:hypothetical protein KM043_014170 [Ampulex compressa]|nr:hypothetical protein KM043_014170 [Ampulex compressa]
MSEGSSEVLQDDERGEDETDERDQDTSSILHMDYRYSRAYFYTLAESDPRSKIYILLYSVLWIQDRVMMFLGLTGREYLFHELINANDRYFEDKLLNFLILDLYGETSLERKVIFFYKTYTTETVHEEVSTWEESKSAKIAALTAFTTKGRLHRLTKSAPGKVGKLDDDERKGEKRGTKKYKKSKARLDKVEGSPISSSMAMSSVTLRSDRGSGLYGSSEEEFEDTREDEGDERGSGDFSLRSSKKSQSKSAPSDSSSFAPPPGEEDKYVLTKRMVERVQKTPVLNMICGEVDGNRADLKDTTFYYFLRTSDEGIPPFDTYEECLEEITSYLIVGSLKGKFLVSLNRLLVQVFKPLVENQFREPKFGELWKTEGSYIEGDTPSVDKVASKLASIVESRSSALRRPSDFRRLSLSISRKETEESSVSSLRGDKRVKEEGSVTSSQRTDVERKRTALKRGSKKLSESASEGKSSKSLVTGAKSQEKPEAVSPAEQNKKDILVHLDKLISSVEWTLEHIEGDILLSMPKIPELLDPTITDEALEKNKEVIQQSEEVLETYANKVPQGKGPVAECHYWQDRETGLSMLVEQLKLPMVKRILGLLNRALSSIASSFDYFQLELWRYYVEARDNNKFLQTLLRNFKLMTDSDSFKTIAECIPSLTKGLRMIWVLSRYYSSEEKMMLLLERISWQLCQNVRSNLSIKELFRNPLDEVLRRTEEAHKMLKNWKISYLKTREEIELSGKGTRWEFDQRRLFQDTEYIAVVCNDLNKTTCVLQDFYNIFGADLKSIINDPAQIDAIVKRVDRLIVPIQEADFDIFDQFNKENWEATMSSFYEQVTYLENEAKFFIDECFMVLINAEDALKVLLKFKKTKTRATIQEQLSRKFDVIMQQFSKEIGVVENIYNRGKRNPPLLTYHPPMAGAIFWVRQLFHRLKKPVLIFQNVQELKHSELKLLAFSQYLDIAKQMKNFEDEKFNSWIDKAQSTVASTMKKSVLKMVRSEPDKGALTFPDELKSSQTRNLQTIHSAKKVKSKDQGSVVSTSQGSVQKADIIISKPSLETGSSVAAGSKTMSIKGQTRSEAKSSIRVLSPSQKDQRTSTISSLVDKQGTHQPKITWMQFMSGSILVECQLRFQVNFDREVFEIIREAELMEQLGFELPSILRDVGIQKDRLCADIEATEKMIDQYNGIVDKMDKADIQLLKDILQEVEKHIQPGVMRFNWSSLSIADYAAGCGKLLKNLNSIVAQVNQMKKDMDNRIDSELRSYNLFSIDSDAVPTDQPLPCKMYFLNIESRRTELVSSMSNAYQSVTPMLIKLESLVLGTSTGKSPSMLLLYEKYEKKIFDAFITCMAKNMELFNKKLMENKQLFQIDAVLMSSEAVLRPSPGEVYSIILQNIRDLLERLKVFLRWMNGSCLECKPQKKEASEEYVIFSFFEDVMSIQIVNDLIMTVQETAHKLATECWRYLHRWKKYSNLWSFDKNLVCEKFAATKPTLLQYDEKFTFYGGILEELEDMTLYFDINSIRINLEPLLSGIEQHAKEWKQILGNHLLIDTVKAMNELSVKIESFRAEVELVITGLDRFTLIMQAISDIKKMAIQAEVQYVSYQETFRTLRTHAINFSEADEEFAYNLKRDWESLYLGALYRASTLESTCDKFSEMTQEQIERFLAEIITFAEDFDNHGPGSVGDDLDLGLKKMDEYGKLIEKHEQRRLSLVNSEILFDLPSADYSAFLKIKTEYEGMEMIYGLYKEQKAARDVWAKTLWVNLNPQQLIDGMEHFIKEFRKFPKSVRNLSVGQALEASMRSFKNSIPLFIELKNEAMRERHWLELMKKTGQHFDMNPDRCGDS